MNAFRLNLLLAALVLVLALAGNSAWARGGHGGWHGGGHHHHWGAAIGLLIGVPLLVNALTQPAVVYRDPPAVVYPPQAAPTYRYYCPSSRLYYPDTPSCDRDWLRVVPDGTAY